MGSGWIVKGLVAAAAWIALLAAKGATEASAAKAAEGALRARGQAQGWFEAAILKSPAELMPLGLGVAVAASDTGLLAVGGGWDQDLGVDAGRVALWRWRGGGAEFVGAIGHPDGLVRAGFGGALAFGRSGALLVIGAPREDATREHSLGGWPGGFQAGAVHLYGAVRHGDARFERMATLRSKDSRAGAQFGSAVATDGDRVVVGSPEHSGVAFARGFAEVFVEREGQWQCEAVLEVPDVQMGMRYGSSVAVSAAGAAGAAGDGGGVIVVGAPGQSVVGSSRGSADVFRLGKDEWVRVARLHAPTPQNYARFGTSVAADGDLIAVGAPQESREPEGMAPERSGRVHLYRCVDGGTQSERWDHLGTIDSPDPWCADGSPRPEAFGVSLALRDGLLAIGASESCTMGSQSIAGAGAVYLVRVDGPLEQATISRVDSSQAAFECHDGYRVALGRGPARANGTPLLLVGRLGNPDSSPGPGVVTVFAQDAGNGGGDGDGGVSSP